MRTKILILSSSLLLLTSCAWQDDYRQRQPQTLGHAPVKTSNVASETYVNVETNQNLRQPPPAHIPAIDGLSEIPDIDDMRP